jgi:hypothetical protein
MPTKHRVKLKGQLACDQYLDDPLSTRSKEIVVKDTLLQPHVRSMVSNGCKRPLSDACFPTLHGHESRAWFAASLKALESRQDSRSMMIGCGRGPRGRMTQVLCLTGQLYRAPPWLNASNAFANEAVSLILAGVQS